MNEVSRGDTRPLELVGYDQLCETAEDLTALAVSGQDVIVNIAPASTQYPERPVDYAGILEDLEPPRRDNVNYLQSWLSRPFESLPEYAASLQDVVCFGEEPDKEHRKGHTFIAQDRFLVPDSYFVRGMRRSLPSELITASGQGPEETFQLNGDVAGIATEAGPHYLVGAAWRHFGHFVLEGLSRLWLHTRLPDASREDLKFVLYNDHDRDGLFPWQVDLFESLGISEDRLVFLTEPRRFEQLIVPSNAYNLNTSVANAQAETWEAIGQALGGSSGPDQVYLSRSAFPHNRRVANEVEVEQRFADHGFTIVHPEQHPVAEQITLIRNARLVAGNAGSAMYLSAFARPGIRKLVIAPPNFAFRDDQLISHARGDSLSYFVCQPGPGTDINPRKAAYTVELDVLDTAIGQWGAQGS